VAKKKDIFKYIEPKTINNFELAGSWFYHKIGMMGMLKNSQFDYQTIYIKGYNSEKQTLYVRLFTYFERSIRFFSKEEEWIPTKHAIKRHDFLGDLFVYEHWFELPLQFDSPLQALVDTKRTRFYFDQKVWPSGIPTSYIERQCQKADWPEYIEEVTIEKLESLFELQRYDDLLAACRFHPVSLVPKNHLGDFYFLWGKAAQEKEHYKEAVDTLTKALRFLP
jgi:tetratricopeptide (TPR) repeat protein